MKRIGYLATVYTKGINWYGDVGICGPTTVRIADLGELTLEDYSGYGFQEVTGLIAFIRPIFEHNGVELVSTNEALNLIGDATQADLRLLYS